MLSILDYKFALIVTSVMLLELIHVWRYAMDSKSRKFWVLTFIGFFLVVVVVDAVSNMRNFFQVNCSACFYLQCCQHNANLRSSMFTRNRAVNVEWKCRVLLESLRVFCVCLLPVTAHGCFWQCFMELTFSLLIWNFFSQKQWCAFQGHFKRLLEKLSLEIECCIWNSGAVLLTVQVLQFACLFWQWQ